MRPPKSTAASVGLLWIVFFAISIAGVAGDDHREIYAGQDVQLLARQQLPDLSNISTCGLNCLVQGIQGVGCDLTNTTCSCESTGLGQLVAPCLLENCTMQDSLDLAKLQAKQCNLPHESQTTTVLAILITVFSIASVAVGLRLVAKNMAKTWSLDDALIISALALCIAPVTFIILMVTKGFGTHLYDLGPGDLSDILRLLYAAEIVYVIVLLLAKLSLVVFYLKIFVVKTFRIASYSLIGFLLVGQVVIGFLTVFSCHPIEKFWNRDIHTGGCLDVNQLAYANSALAIIQDLIILALPIAMLPGLQMNLNKKISVAMVFLLGSVGFISTIIRLQVLSVFGNSIDPTWDYAPVVWWTTVELGVVIVCACAPMIRNLIEKVFLGFTLFRKSTYQKSSDKGSSPSSSGSENLNKMGSYQKLGRALSPLQFSDNYVRDHITKPAGPPVPPKDGRTVPFRYRDLYAYRGSEMPKVLEPSIQPFDLSWRSTNPYGIEKDTLKDRVGKTNYDIDIEMLERKAKKGMIVEEVEHCPLCGWRECEHM
ncbi:CFEM domain-containing protein [Colletotrichum graminicola]|uniref:CFEM domain-containing protein n=1 Tax=Colletotrichum graminicola (strain M1.001 / M2 / FGSC 10212) TaxID=645133 RepID=E3QTN4_COLGM|nr:CFEM domain-containing protein [Colletotrichum graminicola M1.001]EFQ34309.1 CFEM domain-containing protein [Colletotrichum graminicola M1.001]WDK12586.1 CFEM domain-containing protein [Colletotrichum graminicola]